MFGSLMYQESLDENLGINPCYPSESANLEDPPNCASTIRPIPKKLYASTA
jgi:hypothetical protein